MASPPADPGEVSDSPRDALLDKAQQPRPVNRRAPRSGRRADQAAPQRQLRQPGVQQGQRQPLAATTRLKPPPMIIRRERCVCFRSHGGREEPLDSVRLGPVVLMTSPSAFHRGLDGDNCRRTAACLQARRPAKQISRCTTGRAAGRRRRTASATRRRRSRRAASASARSAPPRCPGCGGVMVGVVVLEPVTNVCDRAGFARRPRRDWTSKAARHGLRSPGRRPLRRLATSHAALAACSRPVSSSCGWAERANTRT